MRSEHFFAAVRSLPAGSLADLTNGEPFLVLAPHPDDESLGAGGLIGLAATKGQDVHLALLTDGGASHPGSRKYPWPRLAALRRREFEEAARTLGVRRDHLLHLAFRDGEAPSRGPAFERTVERLLALIDRERIRSVFTTWIGDPHCDHAAAACVARALRDRRPELRLWAYPVWGWHLPDGAEIDQPMPAGYAMPIGAVAGRKRLAIRAHRSQIETLIDDDPNGFRLTPQHLLPFEGDTEYYLRVPA